jgi:hypothetical protein
MIWQSVENWQSSTKFVIFSILITWALLVALIFHYCIQPWALVVPNAFFLSAVIGLSTLSIFLCSAAELSISETKFSDLEKWEKERTAQYTETASIISALRLNIIKFVLK